MIEIRELIIRANIEGSAGNSRSNNTDTSEEPKTGCCEENIEQMIKLFKEKNER